MSTGSIFSKDIPFSKDLPASVTHCVAVRSRVILQDEHVLGRQWQLRVIEDWRKCMDYETEYEGCGRISYVKSFYIFHGFQVVRSRN